MDPGYCAKLRSRGFGVACERVEDIPREDFPVAEAYYWWPSDAHGQNELWLRIVARALRAQGRRASVFVGFDTHWEPDMSNLPLLVRKYNGTVTRLFFDEGGAVHGPARGSPSTIKRRIGCWRVLKSPSSRGRVTGASFMSPGLTSGLRCGPSCGVNPYCTPTTTNRVEECGPRGKLGAWGRCAQLAQHVWTHLCTHTGLSAVVSMLHGCVRVYCI